MKDVYIEAEPLIVLRKGTKEYCVMGLEDLPMNKLQLNVLLHKVLKFNAEEIALMYLEFNEHPQYKLAHFGINGSLLFCK